MRTEYLYESYFDETEKVLMKIRKTQQENILKAAELVSECIKNDGLVRTFGTGHSHILAEEIFFRAGTLAPVSAILEPSLMTYREAIKSSAMERLEGFGKIIMDVADVVLDNCGEIGDVAVKISGLEQGLGPTSTIASAYLLHAVMVQATSNLSKIMKKPPIFWSANLPGGMEKNRKIIDKYRNKIRNW